MAIITYDTNIFNEAVRLNPGVLSNQTIRDAKLNGRIDKAENMVVPDGMTRHEYYEQLGGRDGVILEDITIQNLTMHNVEMRYANLKNVTFIDCKFIQVNFDRSKLENVKFIGGIIEGSAPPKFSDETFSKFTKISADKVLLDGIAIGKWVQLNFNNGIVVLRNIKSVLDPERFSTIVTGDNLQLRVDHCTIINVNLARVNGEKSTIYVTNSTLENSGMGGSEVKTIWVEKCKFVGWAGAAQTLVIKDSAAHASLAQVAFSDSRAFLEKNTFITTTSSMLISCGAYANRRCDVYIYANNTPMPEKVGISGGNVNIFDTEIFRLTFYRADEKTNPKIESLNMRNVKIIEGEWQYIFPKQGKWENVEIHYPAELNGTPETNIVGYNIHFPDGTPWKNGSLKITNSSIPLEFDKPPVPTLEELGLAQFWKENDFPVETY